MTSMWVGRRVRDANLGEGTIVGEKNNGFDVEVQYDSPRLKVWSRRGKLTFLDTPNTEKSTHPLPPPPPPTTPQTSQQQQPPSLPSQPASLPPPLSPPAQLPLPAATPVAPRPKGSFLDRKVIEALRLGIVPDEGLDLVTRGRSEEVARIHAWLADDFAGAFAIIGEYGIGKTHLLRHIAYNALKQGYAVSFVTANPSDSPFSKPKGIYAEIVRSLRWRRGPSEYGFRDLLEQSRPLELLRKHVYFGALRQTNPETVWEWIEAKSDAIPQAPPYYGKLPRLHPHMTAANVYTYLITSLGTLASHRLMGGKGLLVVFDEAESIDLAFNANKWAMGVNFVNALIASANNEAGATLPPDQGGLGLKGSGWSAHVPFLYCEPSHTKLLFAFTSPDTLRHTERMAQMDLLELDALDYSAQMELRFRLNDLYLDAYGITGNDIDWGRIRNVALPSNSVTRRLVKLQVEIMDVSRRR